jgi:hypothetical protein
MTAPKEFTGPLQQFVRSGWSIVALLAHVHRRMPL